MICNIYVIYVFELCTYIIPNVSNNVQKPRQIHIFIEGNGAFHLVTTCSRDFLKVFYSVKEEISVYHWTTYHGMITPMTMHRDTFVFLNTFYCFGVPPHDDELKK